jgi:acetyl-CoA C-acetyltransferase
MKGRAFATCGPTFSRIGDEYERRYGLSYKHLAALSEKAFKNAKHNPRAQTRGWSLTPESFQQDDKHNPVIEGRVRRQDCSQVTDGGAAVVLCSATFLERYLTRRSLPRSKIARILGWAHTTSPLPLEPKLGRNDDGYLFPEVRRTIVQAMRRAGVTHVRELSGIETHDCFTITEYMAIDHFGITEPGQSWRAIEDGTLERGGSLPMNPSGGLVGGGHPVGASGVRMVLDAARQVTGQAEDNQVEQASRFGTLNLGGALATLVSFVIGNAAEA